MRAEDREPVLDLLESAFDLRDEFIRYIDFDPRFRWDDFLLCVEDGRPVSCVQIFEKEIRVRGARLKLGGIGSVGTAPGARGRGLASELMRRQAERMRERGMALGLLFTGRHGFYGPLGWHARPLRQFALRRTPAAKGEPGRGYEDADLPRVMELYERHSDGIDGTVIRSETYWRGNLRYAPDREFRLLESGGGLAAYVRTARLSGFACLTEFAIRAGSEAELGALVAEQVPGDEMLVARLPRNPALEAALADAGLELTPLPDRSPMWLVLEQERLASLAGLAADADDATLMRTLDPHYWLTDRF
jgi:predicted N-acetyltransferase YhbS